MNKRNHQGLTLIELLISTSVSGLVLLAVLGILGFSTRQLGTQTSRADTILIGNQAMNAMCKQIGQAVSLAYDQNGDLYFLMPASTDAQGNALPTLSGGVLSYATSATAIKFYPSDNSGSTQGPNTYNSGQSGLVALWRATTTKLNGNPKWQPDAAWSQVPSSTTKSKYPDTASLTFVPWGSAQNNVRVTLTMTDREGSQTSSYTLSRNVYLSNHN